MIRAIKNVIRRRRLTSAGVTVEMQCPTVQYGRGDGRWIVCPDLIAPQSVIYSFGVGRDVSFDLDLIERHAARIHAFDPTPASVQWVRNQTFPPALIFHDIGLANINGFREFYAPRKDSSAHFTPVSRYRTHPGGVVTFPVRKLRTIMQELGHERIDLLKMDIEGGEYDVIANIVEEAIPITQLLIEFHHCYAMIPLKKTVDAVLALRRAGFAVFAISERTYEISLIHTDQQAGETKKETKRRPAVTE
jgi:FkbM family methyltransferase